jgi:hypothetical protein
MSILDLYHGGEFPVVSPSCASPRAGRPLDFGSGFYTTTSLDQAERWVGIRIRQKAYTKGCVSHYRCHPELLMGSLNVLRFDGAKEEWFDFVMANRHDPDFTHNYDIVLGPVANDNVYETLTLFEDGIITKQEAIVRLKTYKLVDQILFHSEKALAMLEFVDTKDCII